ncbi:MAG: hypothetical protein CMN76_05285 [Spirochaetaceae bacterium]|nr:hypothetical protein [Spirochaetaceae bacterium]|tara:strand:+ start:4629 stop:5387 length:759 start_codon:yes stop_codon:yes gene_type:complete
MKRTLFLTSIGIMLLTIHGIPAGTSTTAAVDYNPARWSPLAPYIMQDGLQGPASIEARNEKGELTERALLSYDDRGRLVEETFLDRTGNVRGKNIYEYEAGMPVIQKLQDANGKLLSSEIRTYQKEKLQSIEYKDADGKRILLHSFSYNPGQIKGIEITEDTKDSITVDLKGPRVEKIQFRSSTGEDLATIRFEYNESGQIQARTRTSPAGVERCKHVYDSTGKLTEYVYETKSGEKWILSRKLLLKYSNPA